MYRRRVLVVTLSFLAVLITITACFGVQNSNKKDILEINQTTLDYIEGWYEGNPDRMARALHPNMIKRRITTNANLESALNELNYTMMVNRVKYGGGKDVPKELYKIEVEILNINGNIASVMTKSEYIDYLHLVKINNKWVIINVLWDYNRKIN